MGRAPQAGQTAAPFHNQRAHPPRHLEERGEHRRVEAPLRAEQPLPGEARVAAQHAEGAPHALEARLQAHARAQAAGGTWQVRG